MIWLIVAGALVAFIGLGALFGAPYVPSHRRELKRLFKEELKAETGALLVDLGSGDGAVLREAARAGVRSIGVEIHPVFYLLSLWLTWRYRRLATVKYGDMWRYRPPSGVSYVYVFSVSRDMGRLVKHLEREARRLGHPFVLICHGPAPKDLKPTRVTGAFSFYKIKSQS